MNKQAVENLIDKIVRDSFADEIDVYDQEKQTLFANAWDQNFSEKDPSNFYGINQAGSHIEIVLGCISTLLATVKTVFEIFKMNKKENKNHSNNDLTLDLITGKWLAELQLAGLDIKTAKTLIKKFGVDFEKILKHV